MTDTAGGCADEPGPGDLRISVCAGIGSWAGSAHRGGADGEWRFGVVGVAKSVPKSSSWSIQKCVFSARAWRARSCVLGEKRASGALGGAEQGRSAGRTEAPSSASRPVFPGGRRMQDGCILAPVVPTVTALRGCAANVMSLAPRLCE